jgi:TolB-like protein
MGRVYLAHDAKHDRQVAVKVLDPDYARLVGTERFLREIHIAGMLTHPNIVSLYDSGEVGGQLFFVMPYIEGESLRQRLTREGMLPLPQAVDWATKVGYALAYAHEHGVVHRDIKPENLLIQADHLLIADFGIARAIDLAAAETITSGQLVLGTPTYMSPEQASGTKLDGRSDIYSLGCVLYEMLAGEPPFQGPNPQAITAKKLSGHYPPIRVTRLTVPPALDRTLQRALAVNPADRFATAQDFCNSLRLAEWPRSRHLVLWLIALVIGGAATVLLTNQNGQGSPVTPRRPRVVVGLFDNRTGSSRYDALGFMAADWLTEGLQRTGSVDVVPTVTALAAVQYLRRSRDSLDPVRGLARETGANLVVTGSVYQDHDSLTIQAQVADAHAGRLIGAVEPFRIAQTQWVDALQQIRTRLMGLLALSADDRVIEGDRPPTYAAYQKFGEGMDAYARNEYDPALAAFRAAYTADTSFALPLLYASFCFANRGEYAAADSVLRIAARQRDQLSAYDRYLLDYQRAELAGKDSESLLAIRRAAELAPSSKATYNFAVRALEARQPFAAESALRLLSPDVGPMRGWLPYWDVLASALHAQKKHRQELKVARETRRRFPDRNAAFVLEARALAAQRRSSELEKLWGEANESPATARDKGMLAYEAGAELWSHGDSAASHSWLNRAYQDFSASGDSGNRSSEMRWRRAESAARLGRLREALELSKQLATRDSTQPEYLGLSGVLAGQLGSSTRAHDLLQRLANDTRPYTYGRPQFQAGRIAAVLRDFERASQLLTLAVSRGYPYNLELHRDPVLKALHGLPIVRLLDARRN